MNFPYRALLAFVSTFWLVVIYIINDDDLCFCHRVLATTVCLAIPILLSWFSLQISSFLGTDSPGKLHDIHLADGEFLPTYLGYFFCGAFYFRFALSYFYLFNFTCFCLPITNPVLQSYLFVIWLSFLSCGN